MEKYSIELYEQLKIQLRHTKQESENILTKASRSIDIIRFVLEDLRNYILQHGFEGKEQEIKFFKEIKPKFYSLLIYFQRIYHIEMHRPSASISLQQRLLQRELKRINYFFGRNMSFFTYYTSGSVYLDEMLFTRGTYNLHLIQDEYSLMIDPQFCTVHSYKVAKILAYKLLQNYLNRVLEKLEQKKLRGEKKTYTQNSLQWTASKTDLIELLYALQTAGVFNNSQADVKKIARFLESVFNLNLGNYYRVFQEIRIRKKNRTSFLDRMKETLLRRMDEADEQGMGR